MRKFVFGLLLLLIIGAAAFLVGYMPLRLEAGEYGIVYTKTDGWDHPLVRPGELVWLWQALLPTNLKFYPVTLAPQSLRLDIEGLLPSGDVYARYAGGGEEFGFSLIGTVGYSLKPDAIPALFEATGVPGKENQPDPAALIAPVYLAAEERIRGIARELVESQLGEGTSPLSSDSFRNRLSELIEQELGEITNTEIQVAEYRFPDMELYREARKNYLTFLSRSHEIQMNNLEQASSARAQELSRIEILKEYGALLEEYPILLEYYSRQPGDGALIPPNGSN